MTTILIQRGRSPQYKENIEKTVSKPLSIEKIDKILSFLKKENVEESDIFLYLSNNKKNIFAWGTKRGKEIVKKGHYNIFLIANDFRYIGKISFDSISVNLRAKIANILWGSEEYTGPIWFLENVMELNIPKEEVESKYSFNLVKDFGQRNDFNILDDKFFDNENKTDELIKYLLSKSKPLKNVVNTLATKKIIWGVDKDDFLNVERQIIFYGPPGTGKTYITKRYVVEVINNDSERK